jgi:hypothetical protein
MDVGLDEARKYEAVGDVQRLAPRAGQVHADPRDPSVADGHVLPAAGNHPTAKEKVGHEPSTRP